MFKKYMHVEKLNVTETEGITTGEIFVFPKIDGTNASVWIENDNLHFGSRNREIAIDSDNQGFVKWMKEYGEKYKILLEEFSHWILYGEWLVPHTLKTYNESAWRKFYVFDVWDSRAKRWLNYNTYAGILGVMHIDYIPAMCSMDNPSDDDLYKLLDKNHYLIKDGEGSGEGIVIKNYNWTNRFGRQTWAKLVKNEFKTKHMRDETPELVCKVPIEHRIISKFQTHAMVEKVHANIINDMGEWSNKYIPRLLNTIWYDLIREEIWNAIKEFKNPNIDFKKLQKMSFLRTKEMRPDLF